MTPSETIREMLAPGRQLDVGRVWEVVELIEGRPGKLAQLIECLFDDNAAIASRAADAPELPRCAPAAASSSSKPSSATAASR